MYLSYYPQKHYENENEKTDIELKFDEFLDERKLEDILRVFEELKMLCNEKYTNGESIYDCCRNETINRRKFKTCLWNLLDSKRESTTEYREQALKNKRAAIIGGGPSGLRAAIELAFLGANVVVLEKRTYFSRNNVLRLWEYSVKDLRSIAAKFFYRRFASGSIHHIPIKFLQSILLKVGLLLGVQVVVGVQYDGLVERNQLNEFSNENMENYIDVQNIVSDDNNENEYMSKYYHLSTIPQIDNDKYEFNVLIDASGENSDTIVEEFNFQTTFFQAKQAIGITVNFVNNRKRADSRIREFEWSFGADQDWFNTLKEKHQIQLENIVYYRDETHYLVFTATKKSLLERNVLKESYKNIKDLLIRENINKEELESYCKDLCEYIGIPSEFALNHHNQNDVQIFDFTKKYEIVDQPNIILTHPSKDDLLVSIIGDRLKAPFWPEGNGATRATLSSLDACYFIIRHESKSSTSSPNNEIDLNNNQNKNNNDCSLLNITTINDVDKEKILREQRNIYKAFRFATSSKITSYPKSDFRPNPRYSNFKFYN
eukprot:TRINITY_DN3832_c0_g1_i1.p1 TRINITY_DN3832_c0_g1~~TRINITY_DN3832_c0_g1_i1.p1  ORF type:complete len:545 (+),score=157.01 TRINITY_DN3832_c0_g1_i1:64-1698(+)